MEGESKDREVEFKVRGKKSTFTRCVRISGDHGYVSLIMNVN